MHVVPSNKAREGTVFGNDDRERRLGILPLIETSPIRMPVRACQKRIAREFLQWVLPPRAKCLKFGGASRDRTDDLIVANDGLRQETSIWRALGSRLRSKTVQFRQACRELPQH